MGTAAIVANVPRVHAATRPHAIATICRGRQTTFAELDRRANQVAHGLTDAGVAPGGRVAVLATNTDIFLELLFGATKANRVLVPINARLAPAEIARIVNDAGAEMLFVGEGFEETVERIRGDLSTVRAIVGLGEGSGYERYDRWRDRHAGFDPMRAIDASDVVLQVYTSGTTGEPRGVQLTNDNLLSVLPDTLSQHGGWSDRDVNLVCLPLSHVGGSLWALAGCYVGATTVILPEAVPAEIVRAIAQYRVTKTFLVPVLIRLLLQTPGVAEGDLSSLSLLVYGGSPISPELLQAASASLTCDFGQMYGLTETSGGITYLTPDDHRRGPSSRLTSCGRPLSRVELRIVDGAGRDLPVGAIGEIVCRSPQVMKGYWNRPDETAQAVRGGWLYTGDAGYVDTDGYLYIHDRLTDMIVTGGENVYPTEVERVLLAHPAVAEAAVIGVPDDTWGEAVKACVVCKAGMEVGAAELTAFAAERLARYKRPRSFDLLAALPRNASGKVLRRELRARFWAAGRRQVN